MAPVGLVDSRTTTTRAWDGYGRSVHHGIVVDLTVSQRSEEQLSVQIRSATPNFKTYQTRIEGGAWRSISRSGLQLPLTDKTTTRDVCSRNLFNVDGPNLKLSVTTR
jgi:hypothetical protein